MGRKKDRVEYRVAAAYDTETCNIGLGRDTRAYPILFIFNDLTQAPIEDYVPDVTDHVTFYRHEREAMAHLSRIIEAADGYVPIVCAYNLMFDLQPILELLADTYDLRANAASTTNAYTLDLMDGDRTLLRFWDTFHLEQNGLSAMGDTCGFEKAVGDWDYDLIRTPETPLTDEELYYARRDVQVIPAYLRYLCEANEWLTSDMLGSTVITKTSLVRQMAKNEIGNLKVHKRNGKKSSLIKEFETTCWCNLPHDFDSYAVRKACFRGGFTFTAAATASVPVRNVYSVDVVSMHHTFIVGKRVPVKFEKASREILKTAIEEICETSLEDVLERYHNPFFHYIHACVRFRNLRLKKGSAFDEWGIALCPRAKFDKSKPVMEIFEDENERNLEAELNIQNQGYIDRVLNPTFAFSKLYAADVADVHVSECELWCMAQVYEWDSAEPLYGECSISTILPPDYVTLQSNILFERKSAAKKIDANYREGEPYPLDIPSSIPDNFAKELKDGTMSGQLFHSWYQSTVKGMFNAIYGSQAMDLLKPDFIFDRAGEMHIDGKTRANRDNFDEKVPKKCRVMYTYGLRIVGYSRMHLTIAMMLIHSRLRGRCAVTGGDTDSLKITCVGCSKEDILEALKPLHEATGAAIAHVQARVRKNFPALASALPHIGEFEIENDDPYPWHMESWNKARASIDPNGKCHITLAGVSRPRGAYTIETWGNERLAAGMDPREVLSVMVGYNTYIRNDTCHALEHRRPNTTDRYDAKVKDYLGNVFDVSSHQAIALYPCGRLIGDTAKYDNAENVAYMKEVYGRAVDTRDKIVGRFEKDYTI